MKEITEQQVIDHINFNSILELRAKEIAELLNSLDPEYYKNAPNVSDFTLENDYCLIEYWGYCYGEYQECISFPTKYLSLTNEDIVNIEEIKIDKRKRDIQQKFKEREEQQILKEKQQYQTLKAKFDK